MCVGCAEFRAAEFERPDWLVRARVTVSVVVNAQFIGWLIAGECVPELGFIVVNSEAILGNKCSVIVGIARDDY